jgi:ATP-dependent Clp protease adapter protein ClpS
MATTSYATTAEKRAPWTMISTDDETTVIERPETVEKRKVKDEESVQKDEKGYEGGWEVRLYNDPMNKREFVARCLTEICGLSDGAAYDTMMQAHLNGRSVIGRYIYERAEMYYVSLQEHGLFVDMIPVDED